MLLFTVNIIAVAIVSFLQTTNVILFNGFKPNLVFALLAVLANIDKDWAKRSVLVLISALILKFSPGLAWIDVIFISTSFLIIALVDYLPWRRAINSMVAVIAGTVVIGLSSFNLSLLTLEIVTSMVSVLIFFLLFELLYAKKKT